MKTSPYLTLVTLFLFATVSPLAMAENASTDNWPEWRGPLGNGVAPNGNPPITWSEEKNVKWKIPIEGNGHSTPIIWGDLLFILTAVDPEGEEVQVEEEPEERDRSSRRRGRRGPQPENELEYKVLAINRHDGKIVWEKVASKELPHEGIHRTGSWASSSPVTDGEHLIAPFGSRGFYCYDFEGNLVWEKDLGDMIIKRGFGEGSSPALHGDTLIINWDHEDGSFIVALNKSTGEEIWRKSRDEATSWSTPRIVEVDGKPQVIVNATNLIRAYDIENGEVIWECAGMTQNVIPTPIVDMGHAYITSGFRGSALLAIALSEAKGDITGSKTVKWEIDRDTPYIPTPLLYDNHLYFTKGNDGILSCVDTSTGKALFGPERLEGIRDVYSSAVGAAGRIYLPGREGAVAVLEKGPELKSLAVNQLEDEFSASPAVVGDNLYLRGHKNLYCISE